MKRLLFTVLCFAAPLVPAHSSYSLSSLLPGDAVDAYTDLTAYSFSVPHALKKFGFSAAPRYYRTSHDDLLNEVNRNDAGINLFAYLQFSRLRIGFSGTTDGTYIGNANAGVQTNNKLMVSYLFSFFSLGVEGGALRSSYDSPRDKWGGMGAVTGSIYFNKWALDGVARFNRPNDSYAAQPVIPPSGYTPIYQFSSVESQLYALRLRADFSFRWRAVLAGTYIKWSATSFMAVSHLWRYRLENMQLISGLNYQRNDYGNLLATSSDGSDQVNLPIYAILEHYRSIFYIGVSSAVYSAYRGGSAYPSNFTLRFNPQVAYTHRFTPNLWLNVSLSSQSITVQSQPGLLRDEVRVGFQIAYNLAPFGADDEVAFSPNLLMAQR